MAQVVSSGNLFTSPNPLVVGVIASASTLEGFSQITTGPGECDLLEARLDMIDMPEGELRAHLAQLPLPLILTARHPDEGGHGNLDLARRIHLLETHLDLAAVIDVELRSAMDMVALIKKAQARRVRIMGSFHDFTITPPDEILRGAIDFGVQFRLDAVKIATTLRSPGDFARLVNLLDGPRRLPLSVMGMGPLGRASRLALAACGSILNYGHLGESNAPGQWRARKLKDLLTEA